MIREISLDDCLDYVIDNRGVTPHKRNTEWCSSGIPVLSANNVKSDGLHKIEEIRYIPEKIYNLWMKIPLEKGDILLTSEAPAGEVLYWDSDEKVIVGQRLYGLKVKKDISSKYLKYYLESPIGRNEILKHQSGSTVFGISAKTFSNIIIKLPDRISQDKIGNLLYEIDNQINRNKTMVQKLQVLGKIVYEQFVHEEHQKINIKKISQIIWGQCPDGKNILPSKINDSIPYASGAGDIDNDIISVNPKSSTNKPKRIVPSKTICISVAGTVGKIGVTNETISIGRAMLGLYSNDKYGLLYFSILKYVTSLKKQATGAIQKIINNNHLEIIDIPDLTKKQIYILNQIVDISLYIETNNKILVKIKEKILPLLINGQLK